MKSNVQLVPPRDGASARSQPSQTPGTPGSTSVSGGDAADSNSEWSTVSRKKGSRNRRRAIPTLSSGDRPLEDDESERRGRGLPRMVVGGDQRAVSRVDNRIVNSVNSSDKKPLSRRRAPRSAAVSIKGNVEGFSYGRVPLAHGAIAHQPDSTRKIDIIPDNAPTR